MKVIRRPDQYLQLRGDIWHYFRRVPKTVRHVDHRSFIYRSLDTDSRKVARQRRDICASADDQRWNEIAPGAFGSAPANAVLMDLNQRAQAYGFTYKPVSELIAAPDIEELLKRIEAIPTPVSASKQKIANDTDALLGIAQTPSVTISQAIDLYLSEIILSELAGKSPEQIATFSKIKRRAVANFIKINGDLDMKEITRDHAHAIRKFWQDRIHPKDGRKPMSGSTGNKDLGSLRKLYRKYFEHIGEEDRQNPFRNMRFAETKIQTVKSFDNEWVRERILAPTSSRA
jgi:hypothetical protein